MKTPCFRLFLTIWLTSVCLAGALSLVRAELVPAWWQQAEKDAVRDGYRLIEQAELKARYGEFVILDVRPGYEFREAHLPDAVNLEFDLADRLELKPEKQKLVMDLLGPDKARPIVLYCRSYT